ncbi:MAG: BLUF domain-containing protein [Hymenobacter sp.]|nr:MAG: BLUF domain-containing protein [Hymenobacter sp.]
MHLLDNRMQHILYRSQARHPLTTGQLSDLVEQSRDWNETNRITGLLCYADSGHFVQVIEGSAHDVHALFTKIQQDRRHHHVTLLSNKASNTRWFAGWQMAFTTTPTNEFYWLLGYLEAKGHNLVLPQVPINDPQLLTLLQQFSLT